MVLILPVLYFLTNALWQIGDSIMKLLNSSVPSSSWTVWNHTIYYFGTLNWIMFIKILKRQLWDSCWVFVINESWPQHLTLQHANEPGMMNECWTSPLLFKSDWHLYCYGARSDLALQDIDQSDKMTSFKYRCNSGQSPWTGFVIHKKIPQRHHVDISALVEAYLMIG